MFSERYKDIKETLSSLLEGEELEGALKVFTRNLHYYEYEEGILKLEYTDRNIYQLHGDHPEVCDVAYIITERTKKSN